MQVGKLTAADFLGSNDYPLRRRFWHRLQLSLPAHPVTGFAPWRCTVEKLGMGLKIFSSPRLQVEWETKSVTNGRRSKKDVTSGQSTNYAIANIERYTRLFLLEVWKEHCLLVRCKGMQDFLQPIEMPARNRGLAPRFKSSANRPSESEGGMRNKNRHCYKQGEPELDTPAVTN
jgi:hypothetical protein